MDLKLLILSLALAAGGSVRGGEQPLRIVTLGDSITNGTRPGVTASDTFAARLEARLREQGIATEVVNVGIGGERTDQSLKRLDKAVIARRPRLVTIMYGTNDSYVDRGRTASRLSLEDYRSNLEALVRRLREAGIDSVLMTEPRWGRRAGPNGAGEHPNLRLAKYMHACREVAREAGVPLVDHFEHWTKAENRGTNISDWTTDECHPNPRGHQEIAAAMLPVILAHLRSVEPLRATVTGHDVNRPAPFPGRGKFSWPGNIARLPGGELLLVHSAGYYHSSFASPRLIEEETRRRWLAEGWPLDFEAPTGGRSMLVRSRNEGRTWSQPVTLIDLPLDDSPYGLLRARDGTLLCFINVQASWYGFDKAPLEFRGDLAGLNTRQCVVRSTDDGRTWQKPIWLESPGSFYERSHAQPIQLADGGILWPTYFRDEGSAKLSGAIHRSDDSGRTWRLISVVRRDGDTRDTASATSGNVDEPAIALLPDGRLFLISRPDGGRFFSSDDGRTWKYAGRLVESGKLKAPRLFVLADGTIVCVSTYRGGLRVFLGRDSGRTWSRPIPLDAQSYGYPGGLLSSDGSMLVSYCSSGRAPNRIHLLRFRVNEARDGIERLPIGNSHR